MALRAVAEQLGHLAGVDLKAALGGATWAQRKQTLTAASSSRYAGSITRATHDQLRLARMGQRRHRDDLATAVATMRARLAIPVGTRVGSGKKAVSGYHDQDEVFLKRQRLQILEARRRTVQTEIEAGKLFIVRGGRRLLNARHHLDEAGLTLDQWQDRWWSARHKIAANGSHDEMLGNLTVRISPDGVCSILLPPSLRHLGDKDGRYVLSSPVHFSYREADWKAQLSRGGAISYQIRRDAGRWYIDASWSLGSPTVARPLTTLSVGVDLNADHIACWVIDGSGNPVGRPVSIPFLLRGSSGQRDGHLRWAISQLLEFSRSAGASRIFIEDLDFADGKSRERKVHKSFRHLISSFPTSKFKDRLRAMTARVGITLVAVDPAYTSKWSKNWRKPTSTSNHATTGHEAAAIGIGRRGLAVSISRRQGVTVLDQGDRAQRATKQAREPRATIRIRRGQSEATGPGRIRVPIPPFPHPSPPR